MGGTKGEHLLGEHRANKVSDGSGAMEDDPKSAGSSNTVLVIKVHAALMLMQFGFAGHQVLSRVALTSGLSQYVYAIYRNGIALGLMGPFAYILEKKDRPPITSRLLFRFFLLGLTGIVGSQQLFLAGMIYTSATFAATMQNAVPVITFLMAWILGLEKVRLDRRDGVAKVAGTVVCVGGALLMSIYQGPAMIKGWHQPELGPTDDVPVKAILGETLGSHAYQLGIGEWQIGGVLLLINCVSWAAYLIMQAPILKVCPTPLTITAFTYFFGSLQVIFFMAIFTGGNIRWSLTRGPQVYSVLYAGVISSGINFSLQSWAIQKGGPLLVSLYTPIQAVVVAILSVLMLGDSLYLGSFIGGVGEVAGLYLVTWGQVQHRKQDIVEATAGQFSKGDGGGGSIAAAARLEDPEMNSASSALTQPLLASADPDSELGHEGRYRSQHQVAAGHRAPFVIPRRQSSFLHDEPSASFSPHHVH